MEYQLQEGFELSIMHSSEMTLFWMVVLLILMLTGSKEYWISSWMSRVVDQFFIKVECIVGIYNRGHYNKSVILLVFLVMPNGRPLNVWVCQSLAKNLGRWNGMVFSISLK